MNTNLPFDVQHIRTVMFDYRDLDSVEMAKEEINDIIHYIHKNPEKITTP